MIGALKCMQMLLLMLISLKDVSGAMVTVVTARDSMFSLACFYVILRSHVRQTVVDENSPVLGIAS